MIKYIRFNIEKYKAIKNSSVSVLNEPVPLIGVNESGKSSALEAIARFDFRNDTIAEQKKWKFFNRYIPSEKTFSVSAEIVIDNPQELEAILTSYSEEERNELVTVIQKITTDSKITCKRELRKGNEGQSFIYMIDGVESVTIEKFVRDLVSNLPRVFYFDNFLEDQFPDKIEFPPEYFTNPATVLSEYQAIIEGMFDEAGVSLKAFLEETDENTKTTQIAEVNRVTTNTLMAEWTKMHVGSSELDIGNMSDLGIEIQQDRINAHTVNVNIIEKFSDQTGTTHITSMLLSERSLGFRWFFNFSAKKSYGARNQERFIYLFDEPGSYLHNGAQDILLKAIRDLAKDHPVVYSTHSEFLLDPEIININNIRIVEKSDREIKLVPLSEVEEKRTMGALSTLFNALRMKIPISSTLNQKVIVTEGITDFYFWKMLFNNIIILPGFGAGQNEYLISIAIGTSKSYLALFDGDVAGDRAIQKYVRFFGNEESINWKKYINSSGQEIRLESILSSADQERMKLISGVTDIKKAVTALNFSSDSDKKSFWDGIDDETKNNIKANIKMFKKILNFDASNFNYQLGK